MKNLNLLLLENAEPDLELLKKLLDRAGIMATIKTATSKHQFELAISNSNFEAILVSDSHMDYPAADALRYLSGVSPMAPVIIVSSSFSEENIAGLIKLGADDYVLRDNLERLPIALLNAIEKFTLRQEQEAFFNELVARKTLMKDAERLAHFGSWKEDIINNSLYWSDEKFRILGYQPGEVLPSWPNFFQKVHPDDREFVKLTIDDAIENRNRQKYTFRILAATGAIKYIHSEIFVTRDSDLNVVQLNGFIRDISEHTEAEIKLVESEEKYRNLFENNPSPLFVVDEQSGKFLDVNKAAIDLYGHTREEFLAMDASGIKLAGINERNIGTSGLPDSGAARQGIWGHQRKNGTIIQVEITASNIIFEGRRCLLLISNNVSDRIAAINKLKESEARLMASQRIGHIGSWEIIVKDNPDHNILTWTDETYRIFGYSPGEVAPDNRLLFSILHPDDRKMLEKTIDATTPDNSEFSIELRVLLRNGTTRIVRELGEVIFDGTTGKRIKITGTAQDITERKQAAELLQKSEANLRSIFENTDTIYLLMDMQLCIVSFNTSAAKFSQKYLGREIQEGAYAVDYFGNGNQVLVRKSLIDALHGMNLNYELNYPETDGSNKWYYAHFHPVWSEDRRMLGVVMSMRDITERKMSELQARKITSDLIRRNKDLEQFAYIISHNLRAPVANIIGVSEALNEGGLSDEDKLVFSEGLSSSARKLDNVITDLNRILQMKHEVNENKEVVQFSQITEDIKFTLKGIREEHLFQIDTDFSEVNEMVTLKSYLHSIFYNLISNSLKYRRPDIVPVVNIKSRLLENRIELTFTDNGMGIDLERNGEQLFGLYKRFHHKAAEGKGMGLFMVKTQVETLDGKISVKSKVNEGTQFIIEFETAG